MDLRCQNLVRTINCTHILQEAFTHFFIFETMSNGAKFLVELTLQELSDTTPPSAPKATMILPVNEIQLQAYSAVYGIKSEREKAEAMIDAGRYWKQQIGPELDRDARRLSTPPRQANVYCAETAFISPE